MKQQQQRSAACHAPGISSHNKTGKSREKPLSFFFSLPTRRGWVNRDYESRREQSGQRDKSYLAPRLDLSSCYSNGQGFIAILNSALDYVIPSPVPCRHQWTAPNQSVTIDKKNYANKKRLGKPVQIKWLLLLPPNQMKQCVCVQKKNNATNIMQVHPWSVLNLFCYYLLHSAVELWAQWMLESRENTKADHAAFPFPRDIKGFYPRINH